MFGLFKEKFEKFYLDVSFQEKDSAKAMGAQWDPKIKKWYAPTQKIKDRCQKWWPIHATLNSEDDEAEAVCSMKIRSPYEILVAANACYRCNKVSKVAAIAVSDLKGSEDYDWYGESFILMHMEFIPMALIPEVQKINKGFCLKFSKQLGKKAWMNHCDHCDAHFGDFFLTAEPGGAFYPTSDYESQSIQRRQVSIDTLETKYIGGHITDYKTGFSMRMRGV